MESIAIAFFMVLLVVPLALLVRLVAAVFSRVVRDSIVRHPGVHLAWFTVAVFIVVVVLLMPASRHRRPGARSSIYPATGNAELEPGCNRASVAWPAGAGPLGRLA